MGITHGHSIYAFYCAMMEHDSTHAPFHHAMTITNPETLRQYRARQLVYTRAWRARQDPVLLREANRKTKNAWMAVPANRLGHTLGQARRRARIDGRPFSITIEDLLPLPERCPVLGTLINYSGTGARGFVNDCPSIDRFDPAKGYVPGNVRVISWRANRIKSDASLEELEAVLRYMKGGA
jgi:hypothetical protein